MRAIFQLNYTYLKKIANKQYNLITMKKILIALLTILISIILGIVLATTLNYFGFNPFGMPK
ncbi:MAG: hypothetical protein ACRDAW_00665 [Metamycoplasmataceae bacterium]